MPIILESSSWGKQRIENIVKLNTPCIDWSQYVHGLSSRKVKEEKKINNIDTVSIIVQFNNCLFSLSVHGVASPCQSQNQMTL